MQPLGRVEAFRLLLLLLLLGPVLAQVRHPLPVLWMMPVGSGSGRENLTAAVVPAVSLALQDLKKQPAPLGNYEIQLRLLDSQCDPAESLKALFDAMWAGPKYLLLFGGACPRVAAIVARALPALGLVQVSFAASSTSLSSRKWDGNLFSTVPSDRALNQAVVKLLQSYKWTRVGVITQDGAGRSETPEEYQGTYLRHIIQQGSEVNPLHAFAYDAVWVAAKALTRVMEVVKHREKYRVRRNVTVGEEAVQQMLLEAVKSTRFQGVTGPVVFRNGERMSSIELIQIQGSSSVLVGEFNTSTQQLRLISRLLNFKGRGPARDRALVRLQHRHISLSLYVAVSSAAAVIIFVTLLIVCHRVINRKHWLLRSSSRSQDELLLLGVLLSSCSVLFSGLDGASVSDWMFEMFCSVHLWTLSVGHTLAFAALFVSTWRIYSQVIFEQKLQARCVLLCLLLLDAFVLTSWQILDPLRREVVHHSSESDSADRDVLVLPYSERCSSSSLELWLTAVYGYKGPLLGLGCFLAWSVRCGQAPRPAGSGCLTLSVFALTGFTVAGVSGSLLTSASRPVQFCLSSVAVLCCSAFILSWMFGPVMSSLCWNGGEQQQELQSEEDQQLKSRSAQLDVEIEAITVQLSEICAEDRRSERNQNLDHINSPEHVQRRLSVQLPILHHSYLPLVGGVSASGSSLFGSREAFVDPDVLMPAVPTHGSEQSSTRANVY